MDLKAPQNAAEFAAAEAPTRPVQGTVNVADTMWAVGSGTFTASQRRR